MKTVVTHSTSASAIAERIPIDRPKFHLADRDFPFAKVGEEVNWNILSDSLEFIAAHVTRNDRTLGDRLGGIHRRVRGYGLDPYGN